ncbi:MAG: hypothetical protein R6V35_04525 [Candidatus Nanohaloarchaea archaeon]
MVDSSLELECSSCGNFFWYSGEKSFPDSIECPECGSSVVISEDG